MDVAGAVEEAVVEAVEEGVDVAEEEVEGEVVPVPVPVPMLHPMLLPRPVQPELPLALLPLPRQRRLQEVLETGRQLMTRMKKSGR